MVRWRIAVLIAGTADRPLSFHKYMYAASNAIRYIDPSGYDFSLSGTLANITIRVMVFATVHAPTIARVTTFAGWVFIGTTVYQILASTGLVPQSGRITALWALSGAVWTAGQTLQSMRLPMSNQNVIVRTGTQTNNLPRNVSYTNAGTPPYKPDTISSQGRLDNTSQYVRVYNPNAPVNPSNPVGRWIMPRSEIEGLSPAQIQQRFSLPNVPTHIVDVNAAGRNATIGIANPLPGSAGLGTQIQLADDVVDPGMFTNMRQLFGGI